MSNHDQRRFDLKTKFDLPAPYGLQPTGAVSTDDCKAFLADFFTRVPVNDLLGFWDDDEEFQSAMEDDPAGTKEILEFPKNPKKWKRRDKSNTAPFERCSLYGENGDSIGYYSPTLFKVWRGFMNDAADGQIGYQVIEDTRGKLWLGDYIGD